MSKFDWHDLSPFFFASIATTMHCDPNFFELSTTTFEFSTAAVFMETLSIFGAFDALEVSTLLLINFLKVIVLAVCECFRVFEL